MTCFVTQEARQGSGKFRDLIEQFCHRCKDDSGKLIHKLLGDKFQGRVYQHGEACKTRFAIQDVSFENAMLSL